MLMWSINVSFPESRAGVRVGPEGQEENTQSQGPCDLASSYLCFPLLPPCLVTLASFHTLPKAIYCPCQLLCLEGSSPRCPHGLLLHLGLCSTATLPERPFLKERPPTPHSIPHPDVLQRTDYSLTC